MDKEAPDKQKKKEYTAFQEPMQNCIAKDTSYIKVSKATEEM